MHHWMYRLVHCMHPTSCGSINRFAESCAVVLAAFFVGRDLNDASSVSRANKGIAPHLASNAVIRWIYVPHTLAVGTGGMNLPRWAEFSNLPAS